MHINFFTVLKLGTFWLNWKHLKVCEKSAVIPLIDFYWRLLLNKSDHRGIRMQISNLTDGWIGPRREVHRKTAADRLTNKFDTGVRKEEISFGLIRARSNLLRFSSKNENENITFRKSIFVLRLQKIDRHG